MGAPVSREQAESRTSRLDYMLIFARLREIIWRFLQRSEAAPHYGRSRLFSACMDLLTITNELKNHEISISTSPQLSASKFKITTGHKRE